MKTRRHFICLVVTLSACIPGARVVTLHGDNVNPAPEGVVLDNDPLTLRYSFSGERGQTALSPVNKLDRPLYVHWKRSAFIIGQKKIDYGYDVADLRLSNLNSRYGRYMVEALAGTISKADPVGFIPPQTRLSKPQVVVVL